MKKLASLLSGAVCLGAFGLVGCGGSGTGGGGSDASVSFGDASSTADAPVVTTCNPVQQTGCKAGEKCTFVIDSAAMEPLLGTTRCVMEGATDKGQACTRSVGGAADDCKKGLWCSGGTCEEICSADPETCPSGQGACVHTSGIFEDNNVGFCSGPPCNIFTQDCPKAHPNPPMDDPGKKEACYLLFTRPGAPTVCFPAFADDGQDKPGKQDVVCNYINTCQQGYGCVLPDDPANFQNLVCAYYCDATDSGGPSCADTANGGPGPAYSCYQLNLVYSDLPDVPDNVGICALTELWGTPPQEAPPRWKRLPSPRDLSRRESSRED